MMKLFKNSQPIMESNDIKYHITTINTIKYENLNVTRVICNINF